MDITDEKKKMIVEFLLESDEEENVNMYEDLEFLFDKSSDDELMGMFSSSSSDEAAKPPPKPLRDKQLFFLDTVNNCSEAEFEANFFMKRSTLDFVIDLYKTSHNDIDEKKIQFDIYMFVWYLCNSSISYEKLGAIGGVSRLRAKKIIIKISRWIVTIGHHYVYWPSPTNIDELKAAFDKKYGIPRAIGSICTVHIRVKPQSTRGLYFNKHLQCSTIILQTIVDINERFINVYCGEPGSESNNAVLENSEFHQCSMDPESGHLMFPNDAYILGECCYKSQKWLLTPYLPSLTITAAQEAFNVVHCNARSVAEHCLYTLNTRFKRILQFDEYINYGLVANIVVSACILHNICLLKDDQIEIDSTIAENCLFKGVHGTAAKHNENDPRREEIMQNLKEVDLTKNDVVPGVVL